jgi:hypothetical protein
MKRRVSCSPLKDIRQKSIKIKIKISLEIQAHFLPFCTYMSRLLQLTKFTVGSSRINELC